MAKSTYSYKQISTGGFQAANLVLTLTIGIVILAAGAAPAAPAQTFTHTVLHSFGANGDGSNPFGNLIQDPAGNLYGATEGGAFELGTMFVVSGIVKEKVLFNFDEATGGAGGSLVKDAAGNFYGTSGGGAFDQGAVFVVNRAGEEKVLYSFTGANGDGALPNAGLIQDAAGNLYGTTQAGGAFDQGTLFVVSKSGHEKVLHSFTRDNGDGANPQGTLVQDAANNLYGTTWAGGTFDLGTVFVANRAGEEKVLYSFTGPDGDGANPNGGLVRDAAGNLYGTTGAGGAVRLGTVFVVSPSGEEKVLHSFGGSGDGEHPNGGLVRDAVGNLYGTTSSSNSETLGTVFEVNNAGEEMVLYGFLGGVDGANPRGGVIRDATGNLYGTTFFGGAFTQGTVFELIPQ